MANKSTFFLGWELWLQLTFCLGSAIGLVFIAGLIKLFFKNRLVRKHTVLDEEKRARQQEMRSSGIALPRKIDIPFGVRAIQSGIEVDGIWISRSNTPVESDGRSTKPSSLIDMSSKGKERATPAAEGTRQPSNPSRLSPQMQEADSAPAMAIRSPSGGTPNTYRPKQISGSRGASDEDDALNRLEGRKLQPPRLDTYMPSQPSTRSPHISSFYSAARDRRDSSSSEERPKPQSSRQPTQPPPAAHAPSRKRSPFETPDSGSPTTEYYHEDSYFPPTAGSRSNPFAGSEAGQSGSSGRRTSSRQHNSSDSSDSQRGRRPSQSGSVHANTHTRRVNAGFEVLPAGTFTRTNSEMDLEAQTPRGSARLSRKGRN